MKHLIMGTAGHVDHGKTSLIKALTNIDCDTHKEEKERGITINLGFSHIDLPSGTSIGIIDVPGHKDFINTMVSGASGLDFVLFTIAADSGIMPQTIEHLNIIKTLNVKKIIFALTKIDLVDNDIEELAKLEILELIENSQYKNSPIIGVSSVTKQGIDTLINEIENLIPDIDAKNNNGVFRLFPDRIFSVAGIGTIITGSVLSGKISIGNDIYLLPNEKKLRIKSIQRHGNSVETAYTGDRAAINISGIKPNEFERGMLISDKIIEATNIVDAVITNFDDSIELKLWSTMLFLSGTFESQVKIHLLNKDKLKSNDSAIVQIHIEKTSVLLNGDKFILRNSSGNKTIGGGVIIDYKPLHHRKRTPKLIEALTLLTESIENENNSIELIKIELKKEGIPLLTKELSSKINKSVDEIIKIANNSKAILFYPPEIIINSNVENKFIEIILQEIKEFHKQNILFDEGVTSTFLFGKLNFNKNKTGKEYIELLLNKLSHQNLIKKVANTWAIKSHTAKIDENTQEEINWLEKTFLDYELMKPIIPSIKEEAQENNITISKFNVYMRYLISKNKIIPFQRDYIHKNIIDTVITKTKAELIKRPKGINLSEFRQVTGCSKKIIPILIGILEEKKLIKSHQEDTHTIITLL